MLVFTNFNVGMLSVKTLIRDLAHVILAHDYFARDAADRLFRYLSKARTFLKLNNLTPRKVPSVFVIRSVVPESRFGRYDCRTSIVRLTANPRTVVTKAGRLILGIDDK
jgi:hypothetical protein